MRVDRRVIAASIIVVLAALIVAGVSLPVLDTGQPSPAEPTDEFVAMTEETLLWPYTSRTVGFQGRTLAINVVVYGDPAMVERHLRERSTGDWDELDANETDVNPIEDPVFGTDTAWGTADGSTRYVYVVDPVRDTGAWRTESYQLHDGDYLGTRHHIRAYDAPYEGDQWVAIQAHHEHWDWFRVRHTVDGIHGSQTYVEREFMGQPFVDELTRAYVGNVEGPDSDGWIAVIRLLSFEGTAVLAVLAAPFVRRVHRTVHRRIEVQWLRRGMLAGGLVGLYLGVRFGGIAIERLVPDLYPIVIAGALYPVLVLGLPAWAYLFSRGLSDGEAAAAAMIGFTVAILLDYTYLQVQVLPIDTLIHRLGLMVALGLVAVGGARMEWQDPDAGQWLRMGLLLWFVAIGFPLLRFL